MLFVQAVSGAVQPTPLLQQGLSSAPHAPPRQPPLRQVPWRPPQAPPLVTHRPLVLSQQPPAVQVLPAQHGLPGPPHLTHVPALQPSPASVQKSAR